MRFDVAVVGGGPVGGTVATALGGAGLSVALVEAREPVQAPAGPFDARVSALTRASERILRALGVWAHMDPARLGVFREMHVWDRPGEGEIHFDAAEINEPCLGHIAENAVLEAAFQQRLATLEAVTQLRGRALRGLRFEADGVCLELEGLEIRAGLVVGADGAASPVRALAGIETEEKDYAQRAVVSVLRTAAGHRETAWQRFLPGGPVAFLPLPGRHCCVVWSMPPAGAERLLAATEAEFAAAVEAVSERRLGAVEASGARGSFALRALNATEYVRERLALVGDAAHTIHPLAGQGANLGLYDAATLAEVLVDARDAGRSLHARHVLRRYERWRRGQNLLAQRTMDLFFTLFGSRLAPVARLRNVGLGLTDRVGPLKRGIMRVASGLEGDLPALARAPGVGGIGHRPAL